LEVPYQTHKAGTKVTLSSLPLQYTDYVRASAAMLASSEGERLSAYWQKQLAGELPVLNLPTDRPRPPIQTYRGASHLLKLSANLTQSLKTLSLNHKATLYMTLLAAFQVLLYRYTGQEDLLVGSPTIGRNRADLALLVGYFVNPVVLRGNLSGKPTFKTLLEKVRSCVVDALAHQDYPFAQLVEQLQPTRDPSRSPLFQVMFVLQKAHLLEESLAAFALGETGVRIKLGELELESLRLEKHIAQFDLTLMMAEVDGALSTAWQYNTDLFDAATIARMANHFQTLLEGIVADPQTLISDLPLLTHSEQLQLLHEFNATFTDYSGDFCLHQLFETQVEQTPDSVAVVLEEKQLSYQELNQRANQLAHHLQALGAKPEVLVGIYLERSLEMVVSLLAILKTGAAYVPLDPSYPNERLAFMLEDAKVSVLLTQEKLVEELPEHKALVVCLDRDSELLHHQRMDNPVSNVTANNLAYVIYTSGSTGKPKGVMNTHRGICNRLFWMQDTYNLTTQDRVLQKTPFSFDVSIWEFFWPLMTGASLVIARPGGHQDSYYLVRLIQQQQITTLHFVPSMLQVFLEEPGIEKCDCLRRVMCSGEALSFKLQERFFAHLNAELSNLYGPTEAAVDVTFWVCERESDQNIVPIGYPIANTQIYLLDTQLQPVPIGVPGELHISGVGLAWGYLNQPEMTAEKFIPNPFSSEPGARLYKTGDLARYLPNGIIDYLGRIDHQVKIRGCRIELGEIEAVLHQHPAVIEAMVLSRETESGAKPSWDRATDPPVTELRHFLKGNLPEAEPTSKRLVAYCVTHQQHTPTTTELRRFLTQKLPDYMIPANIVILNSLPLMPNGKVDRQALPDPFDTRPNLETAFVAPRTPIEDTLAKIWARVLEIEQVGIHDNFFELGGDSIRSIQVRAQAQTRGLNFSLQQIFQHQTIYKLAQELSIDEPSLLSTSRIENLALISQEDQQKLPSNVEDAYPLAKSQAGLIFHTQSNTDSSIYHDIFLYHLRIHLDLHIFQKVVQELVDRHTILRTSFDLTNFSEPLQLVHKTVSVAVEVEDLRSLSSKQQIEVQKIWIEAEKRRVFDWTRPPLIRFCIHRLDNESFYLVLSFYDAILDGWSTASLLTELLHRYCQLLDREESPIEPPPIVKYRDFVALEQRNIQSEECQNFWKQKLSECIITILPSWPASIEKILASQIAVLDVPISPELSDGLKKLARLAGVPLKNVLLAAHIKVMSFLSGQLDVLTGLESNGRLEEADGERTIGMHINTVPFRLKLPEGTWVNLVQETFATELELLPFRRYPLAELQKGRRGQPLFETVFNYTHFHIFKSLQELKGLEILGGRGFEQTNFTLRAEFNRNAFSDHIQLDLACDLTKICQEQLEKIGGYYFETLTAMAKSPLANHTSQCLLSVQEKYQVLVEWNNTARDYPEALCVHQMFEIQVERTPTSVAVSFDDQLVTYQDLNQQANQLAHYLQKLGVGPEVLVGICVERSFEMVVGLLGILKAGGAYIPLDPTYPKERLAMMLEDTQVPVLLTQQPLVEKLPKYQAKVVFLDTDWQVIAQEREDNPLSSITTENPIYVIYTSGSTGKPKGVINTHQGLCNRLLWMQENYQLTELDRVLHKTPFSFDVSVWEIFWPLLTGARLVIARPEGHKDMAYLVELIIRKQITTLHFVPSMLQVFLEEDLLKDCQCLKRVISSGEVLSFEIQQRFSTRLTAELHNLYGPTEAAIDVTFWACTQTDFPQIIPIGRPIANTQIYLLNQHLQPVPIGVVGELHIGSVGLARGYLNRPELTAERFIPNPYSNEPGTRLYKTGDLARYLPDGNIEFLGRSDQQVKIRGFRIELGEIEAALGQHSAVWQSVVLAKANERNAKQIVAYIVPLQNHSLTNDELRSFLKEKLPQHMLPSVFVILEALPMTPNGKVDRQMLSMLTLVKPQDEKIDQLLQSLEQLSEAEAKAMLSKKKSLLIQKRLDSPHST
jgi:amino acid adenylation domain-containing protein